MSRPEPAGCEFDEPPTARAKLLAAARALSASRGYSSVRVADISRAANLSRETFYTHFPDKQACLAAACDPELAQIDERLRARAESGEAWAIRLLRGVGEALEDTYLNRRSPRARTIEAMLESAGELGYEETLMGELLARAQVSKTQFHKLFGTKRDCFAAACAHLAEELEVEALAAAPGPGEHRANARLRALLERFVRDPAAARVLLVEAEVLVDRGRGHPSHAGAEAFAELVERLMFGGDVLARASGRASFAVGAVVDAVRAQTVAENLADVDELAGALEAVLAPVWGGGFHDGPPAPPPSPGGPPQDHEVALRVVGADAD